MLLYNLKLLFSILHFSCFVFTMHILLLFFHSIGGKNFLDSLLPRLNPKNVNGVPTMPFELEVLVINLLYL